MEVPDYVKSVEQVYFDVSCLLLRRFGLRMLSSVEHRETKIKEELSSWVVRWNVPVVMNDIARHPHMYLGIKPHLPTGRQTFRRQSQETASSCQGLYWTGFLRLIALRWIQAPKSFPGSSTFTTSREL